MQKFPLTKHGNNIWRGGMPSGTAVGFNFRRMKQKLQEEINKQQLIADKYTRIKELIRQEQELIMRKRELAATDNLIDQPRVKEKIFENRNPNWIKL